MGSNSWLASYPKSGKIRLRALLRNLLRNPDQSAEINSRINFA